MTDLSPTSHQATVTRLNGTPLSQHLASLMKAQRVNQEPESLILAQLMQWSAQNHYLNQTQGEIEAGSVAGAELDDPEATYNNLADNRMLEAVSLEEVAQVLSSVLTELLD